MNDLILPMWGFSAQDVNITLGNLGILNHQYARHLNSLNSTCQEKENENGYNHNVGKEIDLSCRTKVLPHQNKRSAIPDLLGFSDDDTKCSVNNLANINRRHHCLQLDVERKSESLVEGGVSSDTHESCRLQDNGDTIQEIVPVKFLCILPEGLYLQQSEIKDAGLGVWTNIFLSEGIQFGPNESVMKIHDTDAVDEDCSSDYSDSLADDSECSGSNWLRYVNYAREKSQGNLKILENKGMISYQTSTEILPGTELLVWHEEDHQNEPTTSEECDKNIQIEIPNVSEDILPTYTCGKCGQAFKSKQNLHRHQRCHSEKAREKPKEKRHKCPQCEYAAPRRWELERHLRVHTGEKPFKCHLCERAFNQKGDLGKHLRTHTGKRPYECNLCRQSFDQQSELESHQCSLRPWLFPEQSSLPPLHMNHQNHNALYTCPHCSLKCVSQRDLETHMTFQHSPQMLHKCHKCEKGFRMLSYLRRHQRKMHGKKGASDNIPV